MKKSIIIICLIFITLFVFGRAFWSPGIRDCSKKVALDNCIVTVQYKFNYYHDTLYKDELFDHQILEIGNKSTHYYSMFADDMDSVMWKAKYSTVKTKEGGVNIEQNIPKGGEAVWEDIFCNYPIPNELTMVTRISKNDYIYTEPKPIFNWQQTSEMEVIMGYNCQKATTFFRGRKWQAWYAINLPFGYGPWKFGGLPGLILKLKDTKNLFTYQAVGISQPRSRNIYKYDIPFIKSSRKNVRKLLDLRWKDPVGLALTNGMKGISTVSKGGEITVRKPGDVTLPVIPQIELE